MNNFSRWIRSRQGMATIAVVIIAVIVLAVAGQQLGWWGAGELVGTAGLPSGEYPDPVGGVTCMPTCDDADGKFLSIANANMATFSDEKIMVWIGVPGNKGSFELEIFDGDFGKDDNGASNWRNGNWDAFYGDTTYTLYADPLKNGAGGFQVAQWSSNDMLNNAWFTVTVDNLEQARSPSKVFHYRLEAELSQVGTIGYNNFKLRSTGYLSAGYAYIGEDEYEWWVNNSIGIMGALATMNDFLALYPQYGGDFNNLGESPYTGDWFFYFYLPSSQTTITLWDGDFDRGTTAVVDPDLDDLNTVGKPEWAKNNPYVKEEGAGKKGAPPDDYNYPAYARNPAVKYTLIDPDGVPLYTNEEPSGTEEWEKFSISTDPNSDADLIVESLKPGFYTLHIEGLDLSNLVWLRTEFCVGDPEDGCGPPVYDDGRCPRTIGYWKNNVKKVLIDGETRGVQESRETLEWALDNVALASPLFRSGIDVCAPEKIDTIARLTDAEANMILQRAKGNYPCDSTSMLARALQQNLAAWLNLSSLKISDNMIVTLDVHGGYFEGTLWDALQEAQDIILNGGDLERAKDIGDQINNGLLGEDAEDSTCEDYEAVMPPDKQPPKHKDMPKAPKPDKPDKFAPGPGPACSEFNTYNVENPTNEPFYGIKFEFASGAEIKDGLSDVFKVTLPSDVVEGMTQVQMEAKAAGDVGVVTLEGCDFSSQLPCNLEPLGDENGFFGFAFLGAVDNGDGTYTLSFQVYNNTANGLSHVTIGLPEGAVPSESGSFTSELCE